MTDLKNEIIRIAKNNMVDIVGIASADDFDKNDPIFEIMPETKNGYLLRIRVVKGYVSRHRRGNNVLPIYHNGGREYGRDGYAHGTDCCREFY